MSDPARAAGRTFLAGLEDSTIEQRLRNLGVDRTADEFRDELKEGSVLGGQDEDEIRLTRLQGFLQSPKDRKLNTAEQRHRQFLEGIQVQTEAVDALGEGADESAVRAWAKREEKRLRQKQLLATDDSALERFALKEGMESLTAEQRERLKAFQDNRAGRVTGLERRDRDRGRGL